jgi:hypothetical protein
VAILIVTMTASLVTTGRSAWFVGWESVVY